MRDIKLKIRSSTCLQGLKSHHCTTLSCTRQLGTVCSRQEKTINTIFHGKTLPSSSSVSLTVAESTLGWNWWLRFMNYSFKSPMKDDTFVILIQLLIYCLYFGIRFWAQCAWGAENWKGIFSFLSEISYQWDWDALYLGLWSFLVSLAKLGRSLFLVLVQQFFRSASFYCSSFLNISAKITRQAHIFHLLYFMWLRHEIIL